jgi:hypothetical protein
MTSLRSANFRLESELIEGLQEVKARDAIPVTEQVRRALIAWLRHKGVNVNAAPKPVGARKAAHTTAESNGTCTN